MKKFVKALWKDESGQGTAEYVLLLAIVAGVIIIFKDKIMGAMKGQIDKVSGSIGDFNAN